MSKKAHETALPKLRFPEFRDTKAWERKELGALTYPISERNKKNRKLPVYSISNTNGFVPQSSQFEGVDSHARGYDITLYKIVGKNTFAYNPARINVGSIGYSGELNEVLISSLYVCFKTNNDLNDLFLWHFIKSDAFNQSVNDTVEGGIRSYLFYENLATIKINVPTLLEQQKIAATLSSLDDLIIAQNAKLTTLQAHRRGLMQVLFPAEGETVPKRRFLEFQDAGEWMKEPLSNHCSNISSGKDKTDPNGIYHLYGSTGVIGKTNNDSYSGEFILAARVGANAGFLNRANGNFGVTDNTLVISLKKSEITNFVYYTLENFGLNQLIFGSGQPLITGGQLKNLLICWPQPEEQQKIADCLSSLDNLITVQSQKIEALKLHKKGLMQALFPTTSALEA